MAVVETDEDELTCGQHGDDRESVELTVLMPCLNEALTLPACIAKARRFLSRHGVIGEVLVADNGSTDGSQEVARGAGARVIDVAERGYGAALRAGIAEAAGRFVVMGDADDSYDFESLGQFVDRLRAGDQLVMGNRFLGGISPGAMPWHHRYLGNPVLSGIGRLFFGSPVRDFHCGLRGFHRDSILSLGLQSPGMEFASEMVVKATLAGLAIAEVPTTLSKDGRDRPPHLRSFRDGWRHLRYLLLHCPRWLFLYPGLGLTLFGWLTMAALAIGPLQFGSIVLDIHTMMYAGLASVLGVQITVFALIGFTAAFRQRLLPELPTYVSWWISGSLERGLLLGCSAALSGVALAGWTLASWADSGFGGLEPTVVMRSAIPAAALIASGAVVALGTFILHLLGDGLIAKERRSEFSSRQAT